MTQARQEVITVTLARRIARAAAAPFTAPRKFALACRELEAATVRLELAAARLESANTRAAALLGALK